jgi:hypothetical protein
MVKSEIRKLNRIGYREMENSLIHVHIAPHFTKKNQTAFAGTNIDWPTCHFALAHAEALLGRGMTI